MITFICGARPNFVKAAPVMREMIRRKLEFEFIHTGQHHSPEMSSSFMTEFEMPEIDYWIGASSGGRGDRVGTIISGLSRWWKDRKSDACMVVGDVDSTFAGASAAYMHGIPLIHLESGLRSNDWTMPEERSRYAVDHMSGLLLTTTDEANVNLLNERARGRIELVGNTMIDTLNHMGYFRSESRHIVATFHRPALIHDYEAMKGLGEALKEIGNVMVIMHPRLHRVVPGSWKGITMIPAMTYKHFIGAMSTARAVITDSGGVQEETTVMGVPCFTYRDNTERPITVELGTNVLVGIDPGKLVDAVNSYKMGPINEIPLWDGKASVRVVDAIEEWIK